MKQLAIIIPAYKATFLNETLKSISNQTNRNFTLYIGDDASPYPLKEIVDKFINKIDLVYHRFDKNLGGKDLVAHWERCIDLTNSEEYFWLFSDDDIMEPNCVDLFYKQLVDKQRYPVYHFDIKVIDENSKLIRSSKTYPSEISSSSYYRKKMTWRLESYVIENIFSSTEFYKTGRFQNFDLAWGSDTATWYKLIAKQKMKCIAGAFVYWRSSGQNISPNNSEELVIRKLNALDSFLKWANQNVSFPFVRTFNQLILLFRLYYFTPYISFSSYKKIYQKNEIIRWTILKPYFYLVRKIRIK